MRYLLILLLCVGTLPLSGQTVAQLFEKAKKETNLPAKIELLNEVVEKSPQHVGAYHHRADAYQALGDTHRAIMDYNRVVALRPKDPFRYYARGLAYQEMKEPAQALTDFSKAISLKPDYENFYLARARAYRTLGKYALALADYKKYVDNTWTSASVQLLHEIVPVSLDAYRYEDAAEQLAALEQKGDDSFERYAWQGRLWQSEHKLDEAISAFSKAVNRAPAQALPYQLRGNAFKELGDYPAALEDFDQALKLAPSAYWFNRRGLVYEELRDFEKAAADYDKAIALDPKWSVAYNNRGFAKLHLKDFQAAKDDFETAIKLDPAAHTPYVNLAGTVWTWKKDRKAMYQNLEKAVNHHFKNFESLFEDSQKGWLFKGVNQTAEFRSILYK